jgi:hypothetical protein
MRTGYTREITIQSTSIVWPMAGKEKNTITSLTREGGVISGNLLKPETNYYKDLFGPGQGNALPLDPSMWKEEEKVTQDENDELIKSFSESEIREALFQMESNKAASPDKISVEFYQKCWSIIREDIVEMFGYFHRGGWDVSRLNYGVITLIPKVTGAEKIQQYRHVCLLNCLYKWITKVLTIRLEKVAEEIILQSQTAFMKGKTLCQA